MPEAPPTRPSLLIRLRDHRDRQAWDEFVELYGPVIYAYLRKRGLQDADAADLTQAALYQVATHVGNLDYDPHRGSFRGWLFTLVRNQLCDYHAKLQRVCLGSGDSATQRLLESEPAPGPEETGEWEREYRRGLLAWAGEQIRPQVQEATWQAFWQTAVEGRSGAEVARRTGLTLAAVYLARGRVVARMRALLREVQAEEDEAC